MKFERQISKHILISQKNSSYFFCFNILNDIFNQALNFQLREPLAIISNSISGIDTKEEKVYELDDEIEKLQKELGDNSI